MTHDYPLLRRIAAASEHTSERTVAAYLDGRDVRPSSAMRIEKGLRALGLEDRVRGSSKGRANRGRRRAR